MKRVSSQTKKSFSAVIMVAIVAALAFFAYSWWSARAVAAGKKSVSPLIFSVLMIAAGALALGFKKARMIAAPLMVAGAALAGVEIVQKAVPMNGASRYRLGQNRPAMVGVNRPADVGVNRPADVGTARPSRGAWGAGRASWGLATR